MPNPRRRAYRPTALQWDAPSARISISFRFPLLPLVQSKESGTLSCRAPLSIGAGATSSAGKLRRLGRWQPTSELSARSVTVAASQSSICSSVQPMRREIGRRRTTSRRLSPASCIRPASAPDLRVISSSRVHDVGRQSCRHTLSSDLGADLMDSSDDVVGACPRAPDVYSAHFGSNMMTRPTSLLLLGRQSS